ncbi:hypothetical protein NQ314_011534 [Rhamnusium bicolor]|uniref:PiggyBac transposable element-derived protein domain-containing protein n=1 Tax=Rhamnusium bicolor TaxID=1586634 RepID=A0AAV8XIK2_9CUCU|nr:hypothetical protein NQ314_011534 [Rhamnusium bicolor]
MDELPLKLHESYVDDLDNIELNDDVKLNNNVEVDNAIVLADNDIFDDNSENLDSDDSTSNIRLSELRSKIIQSTIDRPPQWGHRFNLVPAPEFVNYSEVPEIVQGIEDPSPYNNFNLLFSDGIIDQLVFQTNLYASQKYQASATRFQSPNVVEIKTFLGINLLMSIKCGRVVKDLMLGLEGQHHHLYFDNYFNSYKLILELKHKSIHACETINYTRKNIPVMKDEKQLSRDVCVVNSFILHKLKHGNELSQKNFRRRVIDGLLSERLILLKRKPNKSLPLSIKKHKPTIPAEVRLQSSAHQPIRETRKGVPIAAQRRNKCALNECAVYAV